jgi:hypothetical protein
MPCGALRKLVARGREVVHVDRLTIDDGPPGYPASRERTIDEADGDRSMMSGDDERLTLAQEDRGVIGIA